MQIVVHIVRIGMAFHLKDILHHVKKSKNFAMIHTSNASTQRSVQVGYTIDNQRHGLETQAKFLMLLTPHP